MSADVGFGGAATGAGGTPTSLAELHRGSAAQHLLDSHPDVEQYMVAAPVILAMPAPQVIDSHVARPVQQRLLVHPRAAQKIDPALGFIVIGAAPMRT
jgi:hypothetical protein